MGDWRSLKFTVTDSAGHEDGDLVLVQDTVGIVHKGRPQLDAEGCEKDPPYQLGDEAVLIYHAEKVLVYKDGNAAAVGQKVYWSGVNGAVASTGYTSGYYWIGIVVQDAAAGDDSMVIDLLGNKATLLE
jgi:hypothetical protein